MNQGSQGKRTWTTSNASRVELFDRQGLDIVALIWMVSTAAFVGCRDLRRAQSLPGDSQPRVRHVGQDRGARPDRRADRRGELLDRHRARRAARLPGRADRDLPGGSDGRLGARRGTASTSRRLFTAVTATYSVAIGFGRGNRAVGVIGGLALAGLGLVVVMLASARTTGPHPRVSPPQQTSALTSHSRAAAARRRARRSTASRPGTWRSTGR